jgi:hypothetical protein
MGHKGLGQRRGGDELGLDRGRAKEEGGRVKRRSFNDPGQFKFHILPEKQKPPKKTVPPRMTVLTFRQLDWRKDPASLPGFGSSSGIETWSH